MSWRSDGSPSCLGGSSHRWVLVKTHSTPVPTSVGTSSTTHNNESKKTQHDNNNLREAHIKSLHEMEELKRVQDLRIDEFSRRRLIEDRDTILELTARVQERQNAVNCMNDLRDFERC